MTDIEATPAPPAAPDDLPPARKAWTAPRATVTPMTAAELDVDTGPDFGMYS